MIRDRDRIYGAVVTRRLRAMGIRDEPIAPASPWQNGFAERLIGSIRRECLDHIIVLGEAHLRRILISYADYYNSVRAHRSLHEDAPIFRPIQQTGIIRSRPRVPREGREFESPKEIQLVESRREMAVLAVGELPTQIEGQLKGRSGGNRPATENDRQQCK
jgi:integrase-like protein